MNQNLDKKTTVLIIDDSSELLEVFKIVFEKQGYDIITQTSASNIFSLVKNNKIDILLLDVFLTGSNGREICAELKTGANAYNDLPVVLMSASPENLIDLNECGADGYIEKPFDINYITEKISALVSRFPKHAISA